VKPAEPLAFGNFNGSLANLLPPARPDASSPIYN
jgi:hypothetical protein